VQQQNRRCILRTRIAIEDVEIVYARGLEMYDGLFLGSGANACHIFPPGLFRD
jgi:hypothetical protein